MDNLQERIFALNLQYLTLAKETCDANAAEAKMRFGFSRELVERIRTLTLTEIQCYASSTVIQMTMRPHPLEMIICNNEETTPLCAALKSVCTVHSARRGRSCG